MRLPVAQKTRRGDSLPARRQAHMHIRPACLSAAAPVALPDARPTRGQGIRAPARRRLTLDSWSSPLAPPRRLRFLPYDQAYDTDRDHDNDDDRRRRPRSGRPRGRRPCGALAHLARGRDEPLQQAHQLRLLDERRRVVPQHDEGDGPVLLRVPWSAYAAFRARGTLR